nr:RING finger protein 112-like [Chrysemys picta bellii]
MGREEEPLEGFEWRVGTRSVTKGVWAWSQPFWVPTEWGKVAVLLVDTEGSMDIVRDTETSVKLSALSMLLGSYQILNVSSQIKDTDLAYLEVKQGEGRMWRRSQAASQGSFSTLGYSCGDPHERPP